MTQHGQEAPARRRPGRALVLVLALVALFASGINNRPAGAAWDRTYDVVLYNLPYLVAAAACVAAARRVPTERAAWAALAASLTLGAVSNALRVLSAGLQGNEPSSTLSHAVALVAYVLMYVPIVVFIRSRVPRFHPSMWLDGVVGALGGLAAGVAFVLGPYLDPRPGETPVAAVDLVAPALTVLLMAVLIAVGSILGARVDRTILLLGVGLCCICVSDVVLFTSKVQGTYVDGGPLELGWLVCVVLAAAAAEGAVDRPAPDDRGNGSRIGWRLLALPLVCIVASLVVLSPGRSVPVPPIAAWLAIGCVLAGIGRIAVTFSEVRGYNQIKREARTDDLTGLANRRDLVERAQRVVASATTARPAALLLLDLDGFKEVNDSLGHAAGDDLLRQIGPRLRGGLRAGDVLARLGGDEFAVLLPDASVEEAQECASRVGELLRQPFSVSGIRLHVGVSIGVGTAPAPATSVQELLHCADVAMYTAKRARAGVQVYVPDPVTGIAGSDRLRTMEELRVALDRDELVIFLQPQMDLGDGSIVGAEALIRWNHPVRGLLSPGDLLPAAEQAGLLRPLTERVVELALAATRSWWDDRQVPVSVNLSAANVTDFDLPAKIEAALRRHGLPPRALTVELVEDTFMADPDRGRAVLAELRRLGVRTSIDDYGTGYSSLTYLRHLPADELKLDRSLIADVDRDPRAAAIVQHTAALAHALGLSLVAEGVETVATSATLARLGCDVAQGYAIARPMPVEDFLRWLNAADSGLVDEALLPQLSRGPVSA